MKFSAENVNSCLGWDGVVALLWAACYNQYGFEYGKGCWSMWDCVRRELDINGVSVTAEYAPEDVERVFAPLLAAVLSGAGIRGMGWKPRIKGNIRWIMGAWFIPAILGTIGAALYFLMLPDALDMSFSYIYNTLGAEGIRQLENSGLSVLQYSIVSCVASLTYAPWLNMLFAIGEEAGWRGVMYPVLRRRYGTVKGRIVGGVIWGIWHWPIMLLAGYEYGTSYWGAPVTGPLLFCLIASAMGIVLDVLYDQTDCIWMPALCHGAINAFAGVPTLVLNPAYANGLLLGPLMVGLIGGLPMILLAAAVCIWDARKAGRVS